MYLLRKVIIALVYKLYPLSDYRKPDNLFHNLMKVVPDLATFIGLCFTLKGVCDDQ